MNAKGFAAYKLFPTISDFQHFSFFFEFPMPYRTGAYPNFLTAEQANILGILNLGYAKSESGIRTNDLAFQLDCKPEGLSHILTLLLRRKLVTRSGGKRNRLWTITALGTDAVRTWRRQRDQDNDE
jgi:DNA-binding MarR family transcriptional regulator